MQVREPTESKTMAKGGTTGLDSAFERKSSHRQYMNKEVWL